MRVIGVELDEEDLALVEHVRTHLGLDADAGVNLPGSVLAPSQVQRLAPHFLAGSVASHNDTSALAP